MIGPGSGMLGQDGIHVDMNHLKAGEVNLGTSIMAINFKDGVILGADSRTTTGAYIANRVTDKLTQVHDTIWCCRSGSAADTQAVADIVDNQLGLYDMLNNEKPTTHTAAALFQELCYANKDMLKAGIIIAGYDKRHGGQVYSIPLGGSLHKQSYAIGGSGSTYIYGYCDAHWREGFTEQEGIDFVKKSLQEAIKWDGSSGGVIRLVVLTANGARRHLYLPDNGYTGPGLQPPSLLDTRQAEMGSVVMTTTYAPNLGLQHPPNHRIMVDSDHAHDSRDPDAQSRPGGVQQQTPKGSTAAPALSDDAPPVPAPAKATPTATSGHASQPYHPRNAGQGQGQTYDQAGFPSVTETSPSSPRLLPTYRSALSLAGSEATSPSRIKVRDLSHIHSFASEEYLSRRLARRTASSFSESGRQYEISSMPVTDIIEMHASMHPQASCVLAFHGKNVPSITILSYLSRIHKYCPATYEVFLSLLVYFDRMTDLVNRAAVPAAGTTPRSPRITHSDSPMQVATPPASASSQIPPSPPGIGAPDDLSQFFVVDSYNIHRLVIAGVTCASKFFSDVFYTNSRYAKVGGLPLVELNHLELQFLILNDFRLSIPVEELEAYGTMLVEFYAREIAMYMRESGRGEASR
ncbi:hypothetical protein DV735_g863, partial [Chaetothyriales sp. CBS 134920]